MLNNFQACNADHLGSIEFICFGNKMSFCRNCFRRHKESCASGRCGDLKKLCYSILEKSQYYKLKCKLLDGHLTTPEYNDLKNILGSIYLNYTNFLKEHIQRKVPFFVLQLENQLVDNILDKETESGITSQASPSSQYLNKKKFDDLYIKLKSLSTKERSERVDLDFIIQEMNEIERLDNVLKDSVTKKRAADSVSEPSKNKELLECVRQLQMELEYGLSVRDDIDQAIMEKIRAINWRINKGDSTKEYCELENIKVSDFDKLSELQQSPELILDMGKHFLKKALFTYIRTMKSPYKYCYIMSTCPTPDPAYQSLVIQIQRKLATYIQQRFEPGAIANTFDRLTRRALIMGPELVDIEFIRQPHKKLTTCSMSVYGYEESREPYYKSIIESMGISQKNVIIRFLDENKKKTTGMKSAVERVYYVLGVAYFIAFKDSMPQNQDVFKDVGKDLFEKVLGKGIRTGGPDFDQSKSQEAIRIVEMM